MAGLSVLCLVGLMRRSMQAFCVLPAVRPPSKITTEGNSHAQRVETGPVHPSCLRLGSPACDSSRP